MKQKPNDKWGIHCTMYADDILMPMDGNENTPLVGDKEIVEGIVDRLNKDLSKPSYPRLLFESIWIIPGKPYLVLKKSGGDTMSGMAHIFMADPAQRVPQHDDDWGDPETRGVHLKRREFDDEKMKSLFGDVDALNKYATDQHGVWLGQCPSGFAVGVKSMDMDQVKIKDIIYYETQGQMHEEWIVD